MSATVWGWISVDTFSPEGSAPAESHANVPAWFSVQNSPMPGQLLSFHLSLHSSEMMCCYCLGCAWTASHRGSQARVAKMSYTNCKSLVRKSLAESMSFQEGMKQQRLYLAFSTPSTSRSR